MAQQKNRTRITADFAGAATPLGSVIRFHGSAGNEVRGKVAAVRARSVTVSGEDGREWSVPYPAIVSIESAPRSHCTLAEVEDLAQRLLGRYLKSAGNKRGWTFGFDLAPSRAGVCRYAESRIDLSVSYCLAATKAEIEDTILHEIAHAIVGPQHNHDAVWKSKAQEIGCAGERCHRVQHSVPRWVGECGCGQRWYRQTLQKRMVGTRMCAECKGTISWRRNTTGGFDT